MATITGDKKQSHPLVPAATNQKSPPGPADAPSVMVRGADYYKDRG
ncbi:hypothetical protein [Cryobacterium sp. TMT1-21]|nr:hypothetical protein [Cryobacterium sp. TMT1-21]